MKKLGTYLLIVGFITGQLWGLYHLALMPELVWRGVELLYWKYQLAVATQEQIQAGDSITITGLTFNGAVPEAKSHSYNRVTIIWDSSSGAVVETDGWPNAKDCPYDKGKQANICKE